MALVDTILSLPIPTYNPPPRFRVYIGDPITKKHVYSGRYSYQSTLPIDSEWKAVKAEMARLSLKLFGVDYTKGVRKPKSIDGLIVEAEGGHKIVVKRITL